jgi:hypothetical protein
MRPISGIHASASRVSPMPDLAVQATGKALRNPRRESDHAEFGYVPSPAHAPSVKRGIADKDFVLRGHNREQVPHRSAIIHQSTSACCVMSRCRKSRSSTGRARAKLISGSRSAVVSGRRTIVRPVRLNCIGNSCLGGENGFIGNWTRAPSDRYSILRLDDCQARLDAHARDV